MPSLWKFGGLTPIVVVQRAINELGQDELSTRSAALSYYFILALFPMFLFLVSLIGLFAGPESELRENILSALGRMAPGLASELVHSVVSETSKASSHVKVGAGILGALWAASAGMSAVVVSLNVVYKLKETRPWWKQKLTVVGLTMGLAVLIILALGLILYGGKIGQLVAMSVGLDDVFKVVWGVLQWPLSFAAMFLAFSLIYYFGPNTQGSWHWVTPGAALGVAIWLLASLGFRLYLHFFNSYNATYGSLGAVIILLLWLYLTGVAILIGAELNWVIEDEDRSIARHEAAIQRVQRQMKAA
ncbi:MAG: Ribonuclease [Candidatus Sulfotelmatobacter sp.]|nr:Ribonuclease [Candidatus Sulfotelmatobacter sp.]